MSLPSHFSPRPAPNFFKTEETVTIAFRAHGQDIVRIENLPRTPERPALRRRLLKLVEARVDSSRRKRLQKSFYRPARLSLITIKRPEGRTSKRAEMRQLTIGGKTIL